MSLYTQASVPQPALELNFYLVCYIDCAETILRFDSLNDIEVYCAHVDWSSPDNTIVAIFQGDKIEFRKQTIIKFGEV